MMMDIPVSVAVFLCSDCAHGKNCVEPIIRETSAGGVTCMAYAPVKRDAMKPDHVLALPDREPCADCACRKGTKPNQTPHTMADFTFAVDRLEPFFCHDAGHGRICAGWLRAAKAHITRERALADVATEGMRP